MDRSEMLMQTTFATPVFQWKYSGERYEFLGDESALVVVDFANSIVKDNTCPGPSARILRDQLRTGGTMSADPFLDSTVPFCFLMVQGEERVEIVILQGKRLIYTRVIGG
jgi:hypothetical protein